MDKINVSIKSSTWLIILTAIVFSFVLPQFGYFLKPYLNYFLMLMMFLSCLDLNASEIITSLKDFKSIILMLLIVHLASPFVVFLLKGYFSEPIFLGLIIASTIPAGRSAVFLSNIYGGKPIKALVSTSISNIFSPITVPIFVWLFANTSINVNSWQMSSTIIYLVLIPLIFALFIGKTNVGKQINNYSPSLSVVLLFLIIVGIISPLKDIIIQNQATAIFLSAIVTFLIILDFSLGFLLGKDRSDKVTYAISSSYKNYTLGTLLSLTLFSPLVALPSIIYTVISNLLLIPLQLMFKHHHSQSIHRHKKHKNIILFTIGLIVTIVLARSPFFQQLISLLTPYTYLAAFFGGMLFASTFTITTGALILLKIASSGSPILLILIGGLGAVTCDILIFYFFKDHVAKDISPVYDEFINHNHLKKILHTHYFAWTLPVIGAFIIASPLPDELAIGLLGVSQISTFKFFLISFGSHLLGMTTIIGGSKLF